MSIFAAHRILRMRGIYLFSWANLGETLEEVSISSSSIIRAVQKTCLEAIRADLVSSAHDCSEGGLAIALAECCISNSEHRIGAAIGLSALSSSLSTLNSQLSTIGPSALLFGETQSRIIISCPPKNFSCIGDIANKNKTPFLRLGEVEGDSLIISSNGKKLIDIKVNEINRIWRGSLPRRV